MKVEVISMKRREVIENIGTVVANDICLSDTTIGVYIPIESESDTIREKRERFEACVKREAKESLPDVNFDECKLYVETDLFINTGYRDDSGKYKMYFSVGFIMWYEDAEENEIYCNFSQHYDIELSEKDKEYIKKIIAQKIIEVMM